MKKIVYFLFVFSVLVSCKNDSKTDEKASNNNAYENILEKVSQSYHSILIEEVLQTKNYSYIRYSQDGKEFWGAVGAMPLEVGETYYYRDAMEMKNFESKALERIFPSIWFIDALSEVSPEKMSKTAEKSENLAKGHNTARDVHKQIQVEKAASGYSLAEIFENKSKLKNSDVIVRGQVVKLNKNIMKTNWVHIQDGTSYNKLFDLTITTSEPIDFEVGDVVTFKGKLLLNKDFGYGYKYDYLIDDAKIQN
jgi:hypothetical protein